MNLCLFVYQNIKQNKTKIKQGERGERDVEVMGEKGELRVITKVTKEEERAGRY